MREDMAHVIVHRPRRGGGRERKGRAASFDELPSHEGMRRPYMVAGEPKELNENLAPLRRYLERQVGRPWDKVYSEIARHLRVDNTVQQHVRDHLSNFVATKPRVGKRRFGFLWYQSLYVDPNDGLLKRTDRLEAKTIPRRRPRPHEEPERIHLSADRELRRVDGLWYEVTLAPLPDPEYREFTELRKIPLKLYMRTSPVVEMEMRVRRLVTPAVRDTVSGAVVPVGPEIDDAKAWAEYRRCHPDRRYAVGKRTLSRRELKRHGLSNLVEI
jgi:hypothetical protein